jgi:hypothetical protein
MDSHGQPWTVSAGPVSLHRGDRRARYVPDGEVTSGASQVLTDKPTGPPICGCAGEARSYTHSQADSASSILVTRSSDVLAVQRQYPECDPFPLLGSC